MGGWLSRRENASLIRMKIKCDNFVLFERKAFFLEKGKEQCAVEGAGLESFNDRMTKYRGPTTKHT